MSFVKFNRLLNQSFKLSVCQKANLSFLTSMSQIHITENLLSFHFYRDNFLLPMPVDKNSQAISEKKLSKKDKIKARGGLVLNPNKGLKKGFVVALDYKSLYPSIISEFNICFSSLRELMHVPATNDEIKISRIQNEIEENLKSINYRTTLPTILDALTKHRANLSKESKLAGKKVKLTSNSIYGLLLTKHSKFYSFWLGSCITHIGRSILSWTQEKAHELKHEVIMGDTDSIFVDLKINTKYNDLQFATAEDKINELKVALFEAKQLRNKLNQEVKSIAAVIRNNLNRGLTCKLHVEIENIWKTLCIQGKKKYCGEKLNSCDSWVENIKFKLIKNAPPEIYCNMTESPTYVNAFKGMEASRKDYALVSKQLLYYFCEYIMVDSEVNEDGYTIENEVEMVDAIRKFTKYLKSCLAYIWENLNSEKRQEYFAFKRKKSSLKAPNQATGASKTKTNFNPLNQ